MPGRSRLVAVLSVVVLGCALIAYAAFRGRSPRSRVTTWAEANQLDEPTRTAPVEPTQLPPTGGVDRADVSSRNRDDVQAVADTLSDSVVQQVMTANYRRFVPCIMAERRRNRGIQDVEMEIVVVPSGEVRALRVNGQRGGPFSACMLDRMQAFSFPAFNGRETRARWSFSLR